MSGQDEQEHHLTWGDRQTHVVRYDGKALCGWQRTNNFSYDYPSDFSPQGFCPICANIWNDLVNPSGVAPR